MDKLDDSSDWAYWLVIFLSVLADILTFFPVVGSIFGLFFSILFGTIYWLSGVYKEEPKIKIASWAGTFIAEIIPGLGTLPFFTATAIFNYRRALKKRRELQNNG